MKEENKPNLDSEGTKSFIRFAIELDQSDMLIHYMTVGNSFIAENFETAKTRFKSLAKIDFEKHQPDKFLDINFYNRHFSRVLYNSTIDNFITYFKDILAEIVIKKPEVLKSSEVEKLDFILSFDKMEDLINAISEKKIEELFYKGWKDVILYLKTKLKIEVFEDKETQESINLLIKQRNLAVHNRSKITKEFIKEFLMKVLKKVNIYNLHLII